MKIGEAVRRLGYDEDDENELCVARIKNGRIVQATLAQCADRDLDGLGDVYVATGAFRVGSIQMYEGRSRANLVRVMDLPFDFDLTDYLGVTEGTTSREEANAAIAAFRASVTDHELDTYLDSLRDDAAEILSILRVPIMLWVRTGYGLLALARVSSADQGRVLDCVHTHSALVKRVNEVAGTKLTDHQVSDAGSRLVRLPGSFNVKGPTPRPCVILEEGDDFLFLDDYDIAARPQTPPRRVIPEHAQELPAEDEHDICLALNGCWVEGDRHGIALGVGGMLAKANVPEEQAARIVGKVAGEAGDSELRDRERAVRTSYQRIRSGLQVAGFMRLSEHNLHDVAQFIDAKLESVRSHDLGFIDLSDGREGGARSRPALAAPLPEGAAYGWFGEYVDVMAPTTSAPDAFHLAVALTYAGALIGRDIGTDLGEGLYPNLFTMLVGATGKTKKSTAMEKGEKFFTGQYGHEPFLAPFTVLSGATSGEGIIDQLRETPRMVLAESEFSTMIRRARRSSTLSLMPTLMDLYDMRRSGLMRASKAGLPPLTDFSFSLLGGATPKTLAGDMSGDDINSGFANRVLWIFGEGKGWLANPQRPDGARCAWLLRELGEAIAHCPPILTKDAAAMEFWDTWGRAHEEGEYDTEEEGEMAARLGTNLHKIAIIYAASDGASAIEERHVTAAAALVDWSFAAIRAQSRRWGSSDEARLAVTIKDVLWSGPASHREIARLVGERVEPSLLERTLSSMVKTGQVCMPERSMFCLPE